MSERKNNNILEEIDDNEIIERIKKDEGSSPYMYRDSEGNVTVGVGRMLPTSREAKNLQFYKANSAGKYGDDTVGLATGFETEQAYQKILKQPYGKKYGKIFFSPYRNKDLFNYGLKEDDINSMLREDLNRSVRELRHKFPDFDTYPSQARRALLDMQFNMGDNNFQEEIYKNNERKPGWPKLIKAVENRDWEGAAKESKRGKIQESRNHYVYDLFMNSRE